MEMLQSLPSPARIVALRRPTVFTFRPSAVPVPVAVSAVCLQHGPSMVTAPLDGGGGAATLDVMPADEEKEAVADEGGGDQPAGEAPDDDYISDPSEEEDY